MSVCTHLYIHENEIKRYTLNHIVVTYIPVFVFFFILFTFTRHVKTSVEDTTIARKKLNIIAENKGIKEPHKMSTNDLKNAINRYNSKRKSYSTRGKVKQIYSKFVKKQNILEDDLRKATMLQNMSHDDLKEIAELRKIKNHDILAKEDLI